MAIARAPDIRSPAIVRKRAFYNLVNRDIRYDEHLFSGVAFKREL